MSITTIRPSDVPPDLRVKIEHVMATRHLSWRDAVVSLAREVVSPSSSKISNGAF